MKTLVGKLPIPNGEIDITDPCYDRDVWCRMNNVSIKPGIYNCYYDTVTCFPGEEYEHKRIWRIDIIHEDDDCDSLPLGDCIGYIGVDAGLAGFFIDKPNYTDREWLEFCDALKEGGRVYLDDKSFFSQSGWGDGCYDVYVCRNDDGVIVKLTIVFIDEEEEDE